MQPLLLGIDVGTSFCKAVLLDAEGEEVAQGRARTPWTRVATGAEIDPEALVRAALAAAAEAVDAAGAGTVAAVGIAGMAETGVLVDARGRALAPAIAWHDGRGGGEIERAAASLGASEFPLRTGVPATTQCSLAKLGWQRGALAGWRDAVRWVGVPEWVARALGAAEVAELSLASRTGLFDIRARAWWPEALAWLGVGAGFMGEPVAAGTSIGVVAGALAGARGAQIAIAGHDHLAAMIGAGAVGEADVLHSSGTAEVFVRTIQSQLAPDRVADAVATGVTVGWHVLPDRWAIISGSELSGALATILQLLGIDGQEQRDALTEEAAALDPGDRPLRLAGLGRGSTLTLEGIAPGMAPAQVWRAALDAAAEVSAAALARCDAVGGPHARIVATGGGVRGAAARTAKMRWLGPVEWSPVQEATARGAALLGGVAAGVYGSVAEVPTPAGSGAAARA